MLKLAWRNLWRNRTRTAIVVLAISGSYGMMLWSLGLNEAAHRRMEESAVRTAGGNVLVHAEGYWDNQSSDAILTHPAPVIEAAQGLEGVEAAIPRVIINGLVRSSRGNGGIRLMGIDPALEARLKDPAVHLSEGTFLSGDESAPLVLGRGVVDDLQIELGDRVVLTATNPDGEVVSALFRLSGVIDSGSKLMDEAIGYTTLEAAQRAVEMDHALTQIALVIGRDSERYQVRDALAARLGDTAVLELLTWDEAIPEMVSAIEIDNAFDSIFYVIIFVIVGFGIANTFLMSVMERTRELGLLGAIGLTPGRTARLLISEAFLLGTLALVIGFGIGFGVHSYFQSHGLDLRIFYGNEVEMAGVTMDDMFIRSELNPVTWIISTLLVMGLILMTCVYPAWRAVRVDPAQAMRTYQ